MLPRVAATVDSSSPVDPLTFVFLGVPPDAVKQAFTFLVGHGNGIAASAHVYEEHASVYRNGHAYWRMAATLTAPNYSFCSLDSMRTLVEAAITRFYPSAFSWLSLEKLLNS